MKRISFFVLVFLTVATTYGQGVRPDQRPEITAPVASDDLYTQARGTLQRIRLDTLRRFLGVEIDQTQRAYNPADSVAAADRYKIIQGANGQWYYIDRDKNYLQLTSAATAPQVLSIDSSGTSFTVSLSGSGGSVTFTDDVDDADASPTNELQTISKVGSTVTLSDGGGSFTDEVDDADASPTNELQTISIDSSGTSFTITLSNSGGSVTFKDDESAFDLFSVTTALHTYAPSAGAQTLNLESYHKTVEQVDLTSASSPLTLTVNNPIGGSGVVGFYTFHFTNASSTDVVFPAAFISITDGTSVGTQSFTAGGQITCYYDGTNYHCQL